MPETLALPLARLIASQPVASFSLGDACEALGLSPSTVGGELAALEHEGLVYRASPHLQELGASVEAKVGTKIGRSAGMASSASHRKWLPESALAAHLAGEDLAALEGETSLLYGVVSEQVALRLVEVLDLFCRIGIGQLEVLEEHYRFGLFAANTDRELAWSHLSALRAVLNDIKLDSLGLPSNSSFGIYGPAVSAQVSRAWHLHKLLRHRLSWDRSPVSTFGVGHDEPLIEAQGGQARVISLLSPEDGPSSRTYTLGLDREAARALIAALHCAQAIEGNDLAALLPLIEDGTVSRRHASFLSATDLAHAQELLHRAQALAEGITPIAGKSAHQVAQRQQLQELALALEQGLFQVPAELRKASAFSFANKLPLPANLCALVGDLAVPEGMLLAHQGKSWKVLDTKGGVWVSSSHSPQTALIKALRLR